MSKEYFCLLSGCIERIGNRTVCESESFKSEIEVSIPFGSSIQYIHSAGLNVVWGYISQARYKGYLSLLIYLFQWSTSKLPFTAHEMTFESFGMKAVSIVASLTVESACQVSQLLDSLPRSLFIHCHVSEKSIFFVNYKLLFSLFVLQVAYSAS